MSRSAAIKTIKNEEGILYYDCEIYVNRGKALLKEKKSSKIRSLYNSGKLSISELAKKYGVCYSTIKSIVKRNGGGLVLLSLHSTDNLQNVLT